MKKILILLCLLLFCSDKDDIKKEIDKLTELELKRIIKKELFSEYCIHPESDVRKKAAEAMGRIQHPSFLPLLEKLSNDRNDEVRLKAIFAIGQIGKPESEDILIQNLSDSDLKVRVRTIEALGKVGTEKSLDTLYSYLKSDEQKIVSEAALTLGRYAFRGIKNEEMVINLLPLFEYNESEVRWNAAYSIYRLKELVDSEKLVQYLDDRESLVKIYILKSLSIESIRKNYNRIKQLVDDLDWRVRLTAVNVMGKVKNYITSDFFNNLIEDMNKYVVLECVKGLGNSNKNLNTKKLENLCRTADMYITGEAVKSLAKIDPDRAMGIIKKLSGSDNWYCRKKIAESLRHIDGEESEEILKALALDKNVRVAGEALAVISERADLQLEDFLIERLKSGDIALSTYAAKGLGKIKSNKATDELINVFEGFDAPRDVEPMTAIIEALGKIGNEKSVDFLKRNLNHTDRNIGLAAAENLKRITGQDYSDKVRDASVGRQYVSRIPSVKGEKCEIVTNRGSIIIKLFREATPLTTANFIQLAATNFYDGLTFHRVVPNFVIQGGCPRGDGWGGPGYAIRSEFNEYHYKRGMVGMASAGKDTEGSQFFITHSPQPHLDGRYTLFGQVVEGMDVVDNILPGDDIITIKIF